MSDDTEFSWANLWHDMRYGRWGFNWDDRKPLPGFGAAVYVWYDGPHYALRMWRFCVCID